MLSQVYIFDQRVSVGLVDALRQPAILPVVRTWVIRDGLGVLLRYLFPENGRHLGTSFVWCCCCLQRSLDKCW